MYDIEDDLAARWPILSSIINKILAPFRIATSPTLLRTYLRTLLILLTSSILFGTAVLAYTTFYLAYIPVRGISVPVYLQFEHRHSISHASTEVIKSPYGIAGVKSLVSRQKYDVVVDMTLPRSERNLRAGNWMLGIEMRGPGSVGNGNGASRRLLGYEEEWEEATSTLIECHGKEKSSAETEGVVEGKPNVLARSKRPAILTYRSWITEIAYRGLRLPMYVLGWGHESEIVRVTMMESLEFDKGWRNIPSTIRLEVRSRTPLEIYSATVRFVARLEGLRWLMFHYRISSFLFFTALFWSVEMGVVVSTWAIFALLFSGSSSETEENGVKIKREKNERVKHEETDTDVKIEHDSDATEFGALSDTERTFPTLSSQQRLHYQSPTESSRERGTVKTEWGTPALDEIPIGGSHVRTEAEADDEDEEEDFVQQEAMEGEVVRGLGAAAGFTDSGIGTSLDEGGRERDRDGRGKDGLVRRRSGRGR